MKLSLIIFFINVYQFYCTQNLYHFFPERCDVSDINYTFFNKLSYKCTKINRNTMFLNISFVPNSTLHNDEEGQVWVRTYMFRSNEYRKGPVEFQMNICSSLARSDFDIPHLRETSNLKCPILKNHLYYVTNYCPNATNFPPLIPEGRWRLQLILKYLNKYTICAINWYLTVVYPVPILPGV